MRGVLLAGTVIALVPLVLVLYYLLLQGAEGLERLVLHDRSERQLLR